MADIAISAGVYPTVARVGGDDYGAHSEPNLTALANGLAGGNHAVSGLEASGMSSYPKLTIYAGTAVISGYYVILNSNLLVDLPLADMWYYVYLKLMRTAAGMVDNVLLEVNTSGVQPADSLPLCRAARSSAVPGVVGTFDMRPAQVKTSNMGWVQPGDTLIFEHDASDVRHFTSNATNVTNDAVFVIQIVRPGGYRFKVKVKGGEPTESYVWYNAGDSVGRKKIPGTSAETDVTIDTGYAPPGSRLTIGIEMPVVPSPEPVQLDVWHPRLYVDENAYPRYQLIS